MKLSTQPKGRRAAAAGPRPSTATTAGTRTSGAMTASSCASRTTTSILLSPLSLVVVGRKRLDPQSEARLTAWMQGHLSLAAHGGRLR